MPLNPCAGFQFDYVFDWTILKYQQSQIAAPPSRALVSNATMICHFSFIGDIPNYMMVDSARGLVLEQALDCPLLLPMLTGSQVISRIAPWKRTLSMNFSCCL